jgi:hypothetical protein
MLKGVAWTVPNASKRVEGGSAGVWTVGFAKRLEILPSGGDFYRVCIGDCPPCPIMDNCLSRGMAGQSHLPFFVMLNLFQHPPGIRTDSAALLVDPETSSG